MSQCFGFLTSKMVLIPPLQSCCEDYLKFPDGTRYQSGLSFSAFLYLEVAWPLRLENVFFFFLTSFSKSV